MKCPTCNDTDLLMGERLNVQIDYCPKCRGIWLSNSDKLEKIIEQSSSMRSNRSINEGYRGHHDRKHDKHNDDDDDNGGHDHGRKRDFWNILD